MYQKYKKTAWLVGGGLLVLLFLISLSPPDRFPEESYITFEKGQTLKSIAEDLHQGGYIRSEFLFLNMITILGKEKSVTSGTYYFNDRASVLQVAHRIAFSKYGITPTKVTIVEGRTVLDMAVIFTRFIPDFDTEGFIKEALPYEGYLFPDTYFVYPNTTYREIIQKMRTAFNTKTEELLTGLTEDEKRDAIILASLVEKEAFGRGDRAMIAGILQNRLDIGMGLQVDATVLYAEEREEIDGVDKEDSLYNTYTHRGLPPGPISSIGVKALTAALNPAETDYLYYIHDKRGTIHFAKTFAQHRVNIERHLR